MNFGHSFGRQTDRREGRRARLEPSDKQPPTSRLNLVTLERVHCQSLSTSQAPREVEERSLPLVAAASHATWSELNMTSLAGGHQESAPIRRLLRVSNELVWRGGCKGLGDLCMRHPAACAKSCSRQKAATSISRHYQWQEELRAGAKVSRRANGDSL